MRQDYCQLTFPLAVLTSSFLTARTNTPPNVIPAGRAWKKDCMRFADAPSCIYHKLALLSPVALYWIALAIGTPATRATICPTEGASQRNLELFAWSRITVASFAAILVGAELRRRAYADLGKNFTFGLARPHGLIREGNYRYAQHQSYTGIALVGLGYIGVFLRLDGAAGCCVPPQYWPVVQNWSVTVYATAAVLCTGLLGTRVMQEEAMLKALFGKEWEQWHVKTKRFIPGVEQGCSNAPLNGLGHESSLHVARPSFRAVNSDGILYNLYPHMRC
ncbi:hypothetical protein NLG97_g4775 [Lecanicillium saksenae]|uniref:Uncharacterized protein n=1 Tax=Lecanicillium saksenae TaxID=468837 RepID=A0ACC1QXK1_9HYPO|nr:hypothetical protein NLG97_g4775 [Lecanicillium saksenae]